MSGLSKRCQNNIVLCTVFEGHILRNLNAVNHKQTEWKNLINNIDRNLWQEHFQNPESYFRCETWVVSWHFFVNKLLAAKQVLNNQTSPSIAASRHPLFETSSICQFSTRCPEWKEFKQRDSQLCLSDHGSHKVPWFYVWDGLRLLGRCDK